MSEEQAPRPHPQVLFTEIDDGTGVLLHLDTKFYYTLNETGVILWKALGEQPVLTLAEIAGRLAAVFRVEREAALRDVVAILGEMKAGGLVTSS